MHLYYPSYSTVHFIISLHLLAMFKQQAHWDYQKYYRPPQPLTLSPKALEYFQILDSLVQNKPISIPQTGSIPKKLLQSFQLFQKAQKIRYITQNLHYLSSISTSTGTKQTSYKLANKSKSKSKIIQAQCQNRSMLCFYRNSSTIKLQMESRTLLFKQANNVKMIQLQNYLVRAVKISFKYKICLDSIVSTVKSWAPARNYQFVLEQKEFNKIYNDLYNCVMDIRNQELISLFSKSEGCLKSQIFNANALNQKIINQNQYQQFLSYKKKVLEQIGISHIPFENKVYEQKTGKFQIEIHQRAKQPNLFKAQILSDQQIYILKEKLLEIIEENKNELLIESIFLEDYQESVSSCVALLEKYYLGHESHGAMYMREIMSVTGLLMANSLKSLISIQQKKRYDDFIFMKSIDSPLVKSFFNYICFFAEERTGHQKFISEITIVGQFNIGPSLSIQMIKEYFCQFYYQIFNIPPKNKPDLKKKQSFKTTKLNNEKNQEIMVDFAEPETGTQLVRNRFITDQKQQTEPTNASYTRHKFQIKPLEKYKLEDHQVKLNFMKTDWVKAKDGGLICTDQKLLTEHKKIFKHILASIGTNILKGGNILNVSLPVTIFKKQGHLQMIADSFSLAPKMLQNVVDPLERIKKTIIVSVSVGTLGISVQKPFFPTLGETLQVWIGGCPMYMQQITRYPPTSSYIFYGRGYRIHGQVEPKISFGINGGKGYSQRPSYIEFDDGQIIQLSYGKLVISGIFIGERQFNFYDKVFAYDKKNNYFAELIFGARETQIFGKNKQTSDFLYGKIYELSSDFAAKFQETSPPKPFPSKKYIVKVLSQFEGYWNGVIKFDDQQYINFETDLPNIVEPEQFALPSDTRYRKDLVNLLSGNIEQAQKQKQILEQGQRRDRRLRTEMSNSRKK